MIAQFKRGLLYGGQSRIEAGAAELFCAMVPCAEKLRFAGSGSEAVQAALRLARAATGRCTAIKFESHYHGWFDSVLVSVAPPAGRAGERAHGSNFMAEHFRQQSRFGASRAATPSWPSPKPMASSSGCSAPRRSRWSMAASS